MRTAGGSAAGHEAGRVACSGKLCAVICAYVVHILLMLTSEWDENKRRANLRKHRVEFADAATAFDDGKAITVRDEDSEEEERFVTLATDRSADFS